MVKNKKFVIKRISYRIILIFFITTFSCNTNNKIESEVSAQNSSDNVEEHSFKGKRISENYKMITEKVTHTCYFYESEFPYFLNSNNSDSIQSDLNDLVRKVSFKIPSIMQNENYKMFRACKEGDYNNSFSEHSNHVINNECDWCQSEFVSNVANLEQGKYFSLLMEVSYTAGGNWAHLGYNTLNLKDGKLITIPNDQSAKKMLLNEIKSHLLKEPLIDGYGKSYPIYGEIEKWAIDDLSFYFKNDSLRIIFVNGAHGIENQIFDISLPEFQTYLNL